MAKKSYARKRQDVADAWLSLKIAAARYCDAYAALSDNERRVGDDGYADEYVAYILKGLLGLLNCETGNLDCGNEDHEVREIASKAGLLNERREISTE